jgi:reactive intermediate/imine deaminase
MARRKNVSTGNAPRAIGTYAQSVRAGNTIYVSGQIPLDPETMDLVGGDFRSQVVRVFENINAIAQARGCTLRDVVKLNVFITDMSNFAIVNEVMGEYFDKSYPARAVIGVASLPKDAKVEMDAILEAPEEEDFGP